MLISIQKIANSSSKSFVVSSETGEVLGSYPSADAALSALFPSAVLPGDKVWEARLAWEEAVEEAKQEAAAERYRNIIAYWTGGDVGD